uniref:Amino acid transporter transmembrane domain-containing protein n=1 Tax=Kalanchoe fedtschenkoi TaxID=63787 RepID=A0A7N0ZW11_KALFE
MEVQPFSLESGCHSSPNDDDGRPKRTGTLVTASAHIITAVIGSGVLSLAWAIAQLGWIAGPLVMLAFSMVTCFCSALLVNCYRSPDPVSGKRNYTYMDVVKANLGGAQIQLCGLSQYVNLFGITVGYIITASISMAAIKRSNCFHRNGHEAGCHTSNSLFMVIFGCIQVFLCQVPNFHKLSGLSILAAVMSFTYSSIGVGLSVARVAGGGGGDVRTSLTGVTVGADVSGMEKAFNTFQAIGNIAFAFTFSNILIEIQDTLRSSPPENQVMKKASYIGVSVTTFFYLLCGLMGYAAFGNSAPGNFLTGFGFYEPFWLVDLANFCIVVHLVAAYQVFCQPIFAFVENKCQSWWPESRFISETHPVSLPLCGAFSVSLFRLAWRTAYVVVTSVLAMMFPFFNEVLGLIGATAFWPLTVYFPVEMYIAQAKVPRFSSTWVWLKILSWCCLVVSLLAAVGSIQGLVKSVGSSKPFHSIS